MRRAGALHAQAGRLPAVLPRPARRWAARLGRSAPRRPPPRPCLRPPFSPSLLPAFGGHPRAQVGRLDRSAPTANLTLPAQKRQGGGGRRGAYRLDILVEVGLCRVFTCAVPHALLGPWKSARGRGHRAAPSVRSRVLPLRTARARARRARRPPRIPRTRPPPPAGHGPPELWVRLRQLGLQGLAVAQRDAQRCACSWLTAAAGRTRLGALGAGNRDNHGPAAAQRHVVRQQGLGQAPGWGTGKACHSPASRATVRLRRCCHRGRGAAAVVPGFASSAASPPPRPNALHAAHAPPLPAQASRCTAGRCSPFRWTTWPPYPTCTAAPAPACWPPRGAACWPRPPRRQTPRSRACTALTLVAAGWRRAAARSRTRKCPPSTGACAWLTGRMWHPDGACCPAGLGHRPPAQPSPAPYPARPDPSDPPR